MQTTGRKSLEAKLKQLEVEELLPVATASIDLRVEQGKLKFGDRPVADRAYQLLCSSAGIPSTYAAKTPIELMLPHLKYWLPAAKYSHVKPVALPSGDIVGFIRPTAPILNAEEALATVEDCIGQVTDLEYGFAGGDPELLTFSVFGPKEQALKVGDVVKAGVTVAYSLLDTYPMTVSAATYRLVCANGMISSDVAYKASRKLGQADLTDWLTKAAIAAWASVEQEFDALRKSQDVMIADHLGMSIESIYTEFEVPLAAREEVNERLLQHETRSMFDVIDAVTYVGSNTPEITEDPALMLRMLTIGGRLARHADVCPTCHRVTG